MRPDSLATYRSPVIARLIFSIIGVAIVLAAAVVVMPPLTQAIAHPVFAKQTGMGCTACHTNPVTDGALNSNGKKFQSQGYTFGNTTPPPGGGGGTPSAGGKGKGKGTAGVCGWYAIFQCSRSANNIPGPGAVIRTSDFPNFTAGWFCKVMGPFNSQGEAQQRADDHGGYAKSAC